MLDFIPEDSQDYLVIHGRNYGISTAALVIVGALTEGMNGQNGGQQRTSHSNIKIQCVCLPQFDIKTVSSKDIFRFKIMKIFGLFPSVCGS